MRMQLYDSTVALPRACAAVDLYLKGCPTSERTIMCTSSLKRTRASQNCTRAAPIAHALGDAVYFNDGSGYIDYEARWKARRRCKELRTGPAYRLKYGFNMARLSSIS